MKMFLRNLLLAFCIVVIQCSRVGNKREASAQSDSIIVGTVTENTADVFRKKYSPESTRVLNEYFAMLRGLPMESSSTLKGLDYFKNVFPKSDLDANDSALLIYFDFQATLTDALSLELEKRPDYNQISLSAADEVLPDSTMAYLNDLEDNGLMLVFVEGDAFITSAPSTIHACFHDHLSPAGQDYLLQLGKEVISQFTSDGGITIPIMGLGERLAFWDDFILQYPGSVFFKHAKPMKKMYLYYFLAGMDNTPAFNYIDNTIDQNFLEAYRNYVKVHTSHPSAAVIQEYLALLERSDFKKSPEIETYIQKYDIYSE